MIRVPRIKDGSFLRLIIESKLKRLDFIEKSSLFLYLILLYILIYVFCEIKLNCLFYVAYVNPR